MTPWRNTDVLFLVTEIGADCVRTPHVTGELPLLALLRISMHFPHERHTKTFGQHPEWAGFQSMCQGLE